MDLTSARTLLRRINRLFDDLDAQPSALERDLLREYVRRFYESLQDEAQGDRPAPPRAAVIVPNGRTPEPRDSRDATPEPEPESERPPKPTPPKPKVIQIPPDVEQDVQRIEHQAPPPRSYAPPRRIEPAVEVEEFSPARVAQAEPSPLPQGEIRTERAAPTVAAVKTVTVEPTPAPSKATPLTPELKELFAVEPGRDLSDRLATQPISDLHRAFGINDTLVTKSQLFGNDSAEFNATLKHLNGLTTYDEAVDYLGAGPATDHDWANDAKRGAARTFVKLVRRRYVS